MGGIARVPFRAAPRLQLDVGIVGGIEALRLVAQPSQQRRGIGRLVRGGVRRERGDRGGEERSRGETKPGNTGKTGKIHCPQAPIVHCWHQFKVEMQISLRGLRVGFFPGGARRGGGGGQC